jgi:hypothetical protein
MAHLKDRFRHYCCQLWWWDVKDLLRFYEDHYSNKHFELEAKRLHLLYCPYCGTEKPKDKHLHPFL